MIASAIDIREIRVYWPRRERYLLVRDEESPSRARLLFHVEHGDYFATLATILGLVGDQLEGAIIKGELPSTYQISTLETMREDLIYLAKNFRIERK